MVKEAETIQELTEKLRHGWRPTREQALAIYGRICTLREFGRLEKSEWEEVWALLPLTIEEVRDLRV